jgi:iron complex outermembrane receptor protein
MLTAGGGDQERIMSGARIGGKLGESTYGRLSLSYNDREANSLYASDNDAHDGWESMRGSFRVDGVQSKKEKWTVQGDLYKNDEDQIVSPYWITTPPYFTSINGSVEDEGANLLARYEHEFSKDKLLTVQTYYDYTDRADDYYQQTFNIYDFDLQYQMGVGKSNSLTMGTGFRYIDADFAENNQVSMPDSQDQLYSAFLQDEITLIPDNLWFTLGTKWEHNDYTGSEWQPSARILWKPAAKHSVWTSVARAVRTPSMVEAGGQVLLAVIPTEFGVIQSNLYGNEDFDVEELIAYEAGYRLQPGFNLSLDLAVFYNDYDDTYTITQIAPTSPDLTFLNGTKGDSHGLEAVVDWKPTDRVSFQAVYSYFDISFEGNGSESSAVEDSIFINYVENSSPQHQVSLRSTIDFAKDWRLNLWLRYVDEIVVINSEDLLGGAFAIDDYLIFNANITWTVTENIEFTLAGQNLLEDRQIQYASEYTTPPTAIERGFYGKVTWRF